MEEFEVDLESGIPKTVSTRVRITHAGRTQILAELVTESGERYNSELAIWMTDVGGTVYQEGEKMNILPQPIVPTEVLP